jgi:hypothetical protein
VASSNTTKQLGILQHHEAAWHPSTPRSSVASFNTMEQRGIFQYHGAALNPCIFAILNFEENMTGIEETN